MSTTLQRTPFVGRSKERAQLTALLHAAAGGSGGIGLVAGEAGVGKTRFMLEVAAEAESLGFLSLVGRSREADVELPYAPLADLVARAVRSDGAEWFVRELGDEAGEFARLVPEIRERFPHVPAAMDLPPEQGRRYLFDSFFRVLERVSKKVPILLFIDDLHLADSASLQLLVYVSENIGRVRSLLVATYRPEDVRVDHPLAKTLQGPTGRNATRLTLKTLASEEVGMMLGALGGGNPPAPLVAVINGETEGNPFFVEEVVKHLKDERRLFDAGGSWRADITIGELEVPGSIRLVIGHRLERLTPKTRALLDVAAIAGRSLSVGLLAELREGDVDPTSAIAEAERAGVLIVEANKSVSFTHELVRQTLESALAPARRLELHAQVAAGIERAHADRLGEMAAELARHLLVAGPAADPAKTAAYLQMAGDRALDATAFDEARAHFAAALPLLGKDDPARGPTLHRLGIALSGVGLWEEAMKTWDEVLRIAEGTGDSELAGRVCSNAVVQLAWAGRWIEVIRFIARGLSAVGPRSSHRALLMSMQGAIVAGGGDHVTGAAMSDTALALAEGLGDRRLLGQCLYARAGRLLVGMRVAQALEAGERAAGLLRSAGALYDLAGMLGPLVIAANLSGRFDRARALEQDLGPIVERLGHHGGMFGLHTQRGFRALAEGPDLSAFETESRAGDELCVRAGLTMSLSVGPAQLGLGELLSGRSNEAIKYFRRSIELEPPGALSGSASGLLLLGLAYAGRREEVLAEWGTRRASLPVAGRVAGIGAWTTMLGGVEALAVVGENAEAAAVYPQIAAAIEDGTLHREWDLRSLHTLAGISARCAERWADAEGHFRLAIEEADRVPIRLEAAEARRFYAEMLIGRGDRADQEKARELLTPALEIYERAGMPMHAGFARSLLERAR